MHRSILLVFAHPDDESSGVSGTVKKYTQQGIPVDLITATRGEKGSRVGVPANMDTGTVREAELRAAAAIMGIRNIYLLGYVDGELYKPNIDEVASKIADIMRRVEPEIVITFGPDGISGHMDHITVGKAATKAFKKLTAEGKGPRKLYYVTIAASALPDADEYGVATRPDDEIAISTDISEYFDSKIKALSAHRSQQDARDLIEMFKERKDSGLVLKEYLYLAMPRSNHQEKDLFE
jgi:LmbE family N-acetylglucosaminyl deacetylase